MRLKVSHLDSQLSHANKQLLLLHNQNEKLQKEIQSLRNNNNNNNSNNNNNGEEEKEFADNYSSNDYKAHNNNNNNNNNSSRSFWGLMS